MSIERGNGLLDGYQLRLPSFEGPLDVLLALIERERLDISDLSLVAVTDGFLAYVEAMQDPPAALLAEFAGIAARLLVLKSRAMLPRPAVPDEEVDVDDLARQLREYQQLKRAAQSLRATEEQGWRSFGRPPLVSAALTRTVLVAPPLGHLRRALVRSLARVREEAEVAPLTRVISIGEMLDRIVGRLARFRHPRRFHELIGSRDRDETIAGFIALLTLWRRGDVDVCQDALFSDIHVIPSAVAEAAADD